MKQGRGETVKGAWRKGGSADGSRERVGVTMERREQVARGLEGRM